jgi:predicted NUDIX family phosphoesterase
MKGHLFFNTWCASTMLAELIANVDTETDIIIVDRGIFDALVWLTLQRRRGELTFTEAKIIEAFLLLDRWRTLIDLAVVMNVAPELAMQRETEQRITSKPGSIMNLDVLGSLSNSVDDAINEYGSKFGAVIRHDTSTGIMKASNTRLANAILQHLEEFLDPQILVVPKQELGRLPLESGGCFTRDGRAQLEACLATFGRSMRRSVAEMDEDYVQIIGCGVLVHNDEVFLFQRKERDPKYRLYGKATIWQGTHVSLDTQQHGIELIKTALVERITRSLFLSREFRVEPIGYCWDPGDVTSRHHFGVMFRVNIDNDHMATDLRKKEFRKGRGHGLAGSFVNWATLESDEVVSSLETWSQAILRNLKDFKGLREAV